MKTIIEMAGEAGIFNGDGDWSSCREEYEGVVKRFAELVTEQANARANTSWTLMCNKMVAFEREACAKVCERYWSSSLGSDGTAAAIASAIRARGNT